MPLEFKVCDKGIWIYKEREFRLEVFPKWEPRQLALVLEMLGRFIGSKTEGSYVKQIAGCLGIDEKILNMKMALNSDEREEGSIATYSLFTKFSSYQNLSVLSSISEGVCHKLFKTLKVTQIIRQVGVTFDSLDIGIKFYSSKSNISKWFKVPMEEGSLIINISNSKLKCQANMRKSCDERNLEFVRDMLSLLAEISGVNVRELDRYWDLDVSLS